MNANLVSVSVTPHFIDTQATKDGKRYVFRYEVTVTNNSSCDCQLMSRHWVIQDGNGKTEEVYGEGVIGEQPIIRPGEQFSYASHAVLKTDIGTMSGRYFMVWLGFQNDTPETFEVPIEPFILTIPRVLH